MGFLATLPVALMALVCNGAALAQDTATPIWPTKGWQTSSPEEQGMDSKELIELIDFGTTYNFDSLLIVRHGKIVVEAYYAPYAAGIPHKLNSATKAVISTLTAITVKEGLLDSTRHKVLDYFDRNNVANIDDRKEAITVQNLLDMTSGLAWVELGLEDSRDSSDFQMSRSPDWVKFILDQPMSTAPGDTFNYNRGNSHLLSAILSCSGKGNLRNNGRLRLTERS